MNNKIKTAMFGFLAVAMISTIIGISSYATAQETTNTNEIDLPSNIQVQDINSLPPHESPLSESEINVLDKYLKRMHHITTTGNEMRQNGLSPQGSENFQKLVTEYEEIQGHLKEMRDARLALQTLTDEEYDEMKLVQKKISNRIPAVWGSGIDSVEGTLYIRIDPSDVTPQFYNKVVRIADGVSVTVQELVNNSMLQSGSCDSNEVCNPLVGGSPLKDTEFGLPCTETIGAERNVWWWTETGIITAGHCYQSDSKNGKVNQPNSSDESYKVGTLTKRVFNDNCDCAFVKSDSRTVSTDKINMGTWDYTLSGKGNGEIENTVFIKLGKTGGYKIGTIVDTSGEFSPMSSYGETTNLKNLIVVKGLITQDGDSGSPIITLGDKHLSGAYIGKNLELDEYYFITWSTLDSQLDLT